MAKVWIGEEWHEFPEVSTGPIECRVKKCGLGPNYIQKWLKELKGLEKTWGLFPRASREAESWSWMSSPRSSLIQLISFCSLIQLISFPFNFKMHLSVTHIIIHFPPQQIYNNGNLHLGCFQINPFNSNVWKDTLCFS